MTIKVYVSGICGSQEVRKQQQRVLFILQSLLIDLQVIDVTEPGKDTELTFMQEEVKKHDKNTSLPPQIFNGEMYCGDYSDFDVANDDDKIMQFLKLEEKSKEPPGSVNGVGTHGDAKETMDTIVEQNSINGISEDLDALVEPESDTIPNETNEDKPAEDEPEVQVSGEGGQEPMKDESEPESE